MILPFKCHSMTMSLSCICYENRPSGIYGIRSLQRYSTNFLCYQLNLYCGVRRIQQVGGGNFGQGWTFDLPSSAYGFRTGMSYCLPPTAYCILQRPRWKSAANHRSLPAAKRRPSPSYATNSLFHSRRKKCPAWFRPQPAAKRRT